MNVNGPVSVDMKVMKARKDKVVAQSADGLTSWLSGTPNLSLVWGAARFTGPHSLDVAGQVLEAPKTFINVGGRATLPNWPGIHDVPVLTNTSMMQLDTLPEHLLIVGGSYIGLEFAQMFRRFGSKVTVIEYGDRLIAREDPDVSKEVQAIPRTNVEGVWALGDVNGRGAFTHTSYNDLEIVAASLFDNDPRRASDRIPAYALFIDPPLGRAGMTETEVHATGRPALVGVMPMSRVGRARERGETQGFIKVLVDAQTERILGAALLGIEGDEAVHLLLDARAAGVSYKVIQRAVHIHPTVSELIPTLLASLRPLAA